MSVCVTVCMYSLTIPPSVLQLPSLSPTYLACLAFSPLYLDIAVKHDNSGAKVSKDEEEDDIGFVLLGIKGTFSLSAVVDSVHHEGRNPYHQHAAPVDVGLAFREECLYIQIVSFISGLVYRGIEMTP